MGLFAADAGAAPIEVASYSKAGSFRGALDERGNVGVPAGYNDAAGSQQVHDDSTLLSGPATRSVGISQVYRGTRDAGRVVTESATELLHDATPRRSIPPPGTCRTVRPSRPESARGVTVEVRPRRR